MPVVNGKPGTLRVRGKLRAQCRVGIAKLTELLNYQTKSSALPKPPNPPFMLAPEITTLQNAVIDLQNHLTQKN